MKTHESETEMIVLIETIAPHGGTLINRIAEGDQRGEMLERAGRLVRSEGHHLYVRGEKTGITRFANNEITDNQVTADARVTIRAYAGDRAGIATVNQLDEDTLRSGVRRAEEIARESPVDPEYTGPPDEQAYPETNGFDEASANATPTGNTASFTTRALSSLTAVTILKESMLIKTLLPSGNTNLIRGFCESSPEFSFTFEKKTGVIT